MQRLWEIIKMLTTTTVEVIVCFTQFFPIY